MARRPRSARTKLVRLARAAGCVAERLESRRLLSTNVIDGALEGKIVFTSPGHGWQWSTTLNRYATDRGDNNEIIEDFGNQEQMTAYADYLLRSGATVVPMRPVGRQLNEVIVDNDSAGATFTGAWSNSSSTRYYDEDYGAGADAIPYRFASTTTGAESSVATYTPNIPSGGFYPVYTWVLRGTDRANQLYRVNHAGGTTEMRVDHSKVGSGWVYLGTYFFNNGSSAADGSVQISNNTTVAGGVVIADAIRFGNGMGDSTVSGGPTVSGYPREDENAWHWIARSIGVGTTLATAIGSGVTNVSAPSNFAQYMFQGTFGEAVYVGFHSNAGGGRGARGLIDTDTADRTPHQADLALFLGRQINQDMQALPGVFEHNWGTGTTHTFTGQFGELDLGGSAEMDATIIEVAFHDSVEDAAIMRDPKGRDQLARSAYQGTIEYFAAWGSLADTTSLPTAPISVRAVSNASGQVTVNWAAGLSTPASVHGSAPTGYKVYTSTNGYGFDLAATPAGTSTTLTGLDPATPIYIKVTATNSGGESLTSEVMTALPSGGAKNVLIVSGFDRYGRTQNFRYPYAHTGDGLVDRVWPRYNNSFDYLVQVHAAIAAAEPGMHVASASNETVISGAVNLTDYDIVIWVSGNESTDDDTFNATEQTKLTQFITAGGNVFLSGSEIAWDLDQQNNGRTFYENTLKGNYVGDDAGTYTATVAAGGIFAGLSSVAFSQGNAFSSLTTQMYDVAFPDVIAPQAGAIAALTYSGGTGGTAGIQVAGTGGSGNIVLFGFPFETMTNATRRQQVMGRILDFFSPISATPGTPNLANANDSGQSNTDDRTFYNNSTPALAMLFQVTGTVAGATVSIYSGATLIGSAVASGTTTVVTTDGVTTLSDGLNSITAKQLEPGKAETSSLAALSLTIDTAAPGAPGSLGAVPTTTGISLDWPDSGAGDLWGYNIYRSTTSGSGYALINVGVVSLSSYSDTTAAPGTPYYYVVRTIDTAGNESANSPEASAMRFASMSGATLNVHFDGSVTSILLATSGADITATRGATTLTFSGVTDITVSGTATDDNLQINGPLAPPLTFNNGNGDDSVTIVGGTYTFASAIDSGVPNIAVVVDGSASAIFDATQHLASLTVNGSATLTQGGAKVIVTKNLSVTGTIDLTDNDLLWDYDGATPLGTWSGSAYTGAIGLVQSGRGDGTWNGTTGVATSMTDATTGVLTGIAVADASDVLGLGGTDTATFSGETVDATTILFKYTWGGDADLNGELNGDDYFFLDSHILQSGTVFGFTVGDFDYNGELNGDDYFILDSNILQAQGSGLIL